MPPTALARCLVDMTPAEWYALINSKVFFWFDIERLNRQRRASGIAGGIGDDHRRAAAGGPWWAGPSCRPSTPEMPGASPRSYSPELRSLGRLARTRWADEAAALEHPKPRTAGHRPVELTVTDAVPEVMDFMISSRHLGGTSLSERETAGTDIKSNGENSMESRLARGTGGAQPRRRAAAGRILLAAIFVQGGFGN